MVIQNIEKRVEETLQSLDGIKRAEPRPYLFTRIQSRIIGKNIVLNTWGKLVELLSKPLVAVTLIVVLIILNITILTGSNNFFDKSLNEPPATKEEFAINEISVYDTENLEP